MSSERQAEYVGGGTSNNHYRIGKLQNGLWVALRQRKDAGINGACLSKI